MKLWPNDDLLLREGAVAFLKREFPDAHTVFVWPEMREVFDAIDKRAMAARRRRQGWGLAAVSTAGMGAILSAALPLVELAGGEVFRWAFGMAAALSAIGLVWTLLFVLVDRNKLDWLENRLRTERLRQLYFQFMLSNPDLAVRAMRDPVAMTNWRQEQSGALESYRTWAAGPIHEDLAGVIADVNDKGVWFHRMWRRKPPLPAASQDLDDYFEILRHQRIGVQLRYIRETLQPGFGSPESRLNFSQLVGYTCAAFGFVATAAAALVLVWGASTAGLEFRILTSAAALCGAIGVICKVLAEGLQLKLDVERYRWYRAAITDIDAEFNHPDAAVRLDLLRRLEAVTYREMREFLTAHEASRFRLA